MKLLKYVFRTWFGNWKKSNIFQKKYKSVIEKHISESIAEYVDLKQYASKKNKIRYLPVLEGSYPRW